MIIFCAEWKNIRFISKSRTRTAGGEQLGITYFSPFPVYFSFFRRAWSENR